MEIKNTELRIGNYLMDKTTKAILKVDELGGVGFDDHIHVYSKEPREYNNKSWQLLGIPLTEEILLKCGFKRSQFLNITFEVKGFVVTKNNNDFIYSTGIFNVKLLYIHQLQNLYFALKSKELIINF